MNVLHQSALDLAAAIRRREISARELLDAHFARIDEVNPVVNAVVTQARDQAYEAAAAADQRTVAVDAQELPTLHGVPMTHKDTHAAAGMRTTLGSPVFADAVPQHDDLIVARFKAAGVISTGKSNVPEFAAGSHTFNPIFGVTRNPYDLQRSAGGSSGGVGVALATGIQPLGDGSDMGGSLRNPASFNNVVGFRPSHGVVPVAPSANSRAWLSRTGPMARTVDDIVLAMSVLAGPDPRVPVACPVPGRDFAELLTQEVGDRPLAGVRVGLSTDFGLDVPVDPEIVAVVRDQARVFEQLGAEVIERCPDLSDADEVFEVARAFDMATSLGRVVAEHRDQVKSDVIWNVEKGLALTAVDFISAVQARGRLDAAMRRFFADVDVLLTPTTQVLPFPADERFPQVVAGVPMRSYIEWMRSVCLISATGAPAVSVPAGFSASGLPIGVQLVAAHGGDVALLRIARAYAEATRHATRRPTQVQDL